MRSPSHLFLRWLKCQHVLPVQTTPRLSLCLQIISVHTTASKGARRLPMIVHALVCSRAAATESGLDAGFWRAALDQSCWSRAFCSSSKLQKDCTELLFQKTCIKAIIAIQWQLLQASARTFGEKSSSAYTASERTWMWLNETASAATLFYTSDTSTTF